MSTSTRVQGRASYEDLLAAFLKLYDENIILREENESLDYLVKLLGDDDKWVPIDNAPEKIFGIVYIPTSEEYYFADKALGKDLKAAMFKLFKLVPEKWRKK